MKNCDLGLENAALDLRPRAAFSRPGSQFFTIRTSQPANNIYTFQAVKNLSLIPHIYVLGCFCKFLLIFLVYLGINSFYQRISKIDGNRKFGRFDVLYKNLTRNW